MVDYKKGLKISVGTQKKFSFNNEGQSQFGDSQSSFHKLHGTTKINDTISIDGDTIIKERIAGALFGVPLIDGSTSEGQTVLQELITNAATDYEGFMVYLTDASSISPFLNDQKFYFCEDGVWFPSPFHYEDSDEDNDGILDSQDLFMTELVNGVENIFINNLTDYATAAANDSMFELDGSDDIMLEANPATTSGNFELDASGDLTFVA